MNTWLPHLVHLLFPPRLMNALARRLTPHLIRAIDRFFEWWNADPPAAPPLRRNPHAAALVIHILAEPILGYKSHCCACARQSKGPHYAYLLDRKRPVRTGEPAPQSSLQGWGCFNCGLPPDGAVAIVCDQCHRAHRPVRFAISSARHGHGRILVEALGPRHVHRVVHRRSLEASRN